MLAYWRSKHTRTLNGGLRSLSPAAALMWRIISLGTKPGCARGPLRAWAGWENTCRFLWPTMEIPGARYRLLSVRLRPYRGKPLILPDRVKIVPPSLIGELHCNNQRILDLVRSGRGIPFAACREDLHKLAAWMVQNDTGRQVQALYGVTLLVKGAYRLGFYSRQHPLTIRSRLERVFMTGLLLLYTTDGIEHLMKGTTSRSYPQEVWISRNSLIRLYGTSPAPTAPTMPFVSLLNWSDKVPLDLRLSDPI